MSLQKQLHSQFIEYFLPEIYLTLIIFMLLLYGIFMTNVNPKINKQQSFNQIHYFTIGGLAFLLYLLINLNIPNTINIFNNLFNINCLTQFIKSILTFLVLIFFLIQNQSNLIKTYDTLILFLISLLGLMFLISANHFIILYLAIEIQSLSFYILASSEPKKITSIEAGIKYFILGSIASGFILFGISLIYSSLGTLYFHEISLLLLNINIIDLLYNNLPGSGLLFMGLVFITVGLLFKIGAAPFHFWLPDVYEGAPDHVTAFFVIVPKLAYITLFIRLYFEVFTDIFYYIYDLFYLSIVLSMVIGTVTSLYQKKLKRLLAFSSITHIGFILMGFLSNSPDNIPIILFYTIVYILMSINIWIVYLSVRIKNKPIKYLTDLILLYPNNKLIFIFFMLNIFSIMGIPPLAGFFSKLLIFFAVMKDYSFNIIIFALIINVISSFYYLKIIKIIFFEKQVTQSLLISKIGKIESFILTINSFFICSLFLYPDFVLEYLNFIYYNYMNL